MTIAIKEPVSFYTHFAGFVLSAAGFAVILLTVIYDPYQKAALIVYALSVMLLFLASSLYHALKSEENGDSLMRKFDHAAIYLMIAGTYTPFIYQYLYGWWRWGILIVQWSIVVAGVLITLVWINKPRKLSVALYLAMGWVALVPMYKLWQAMPGGAIALILAGGASYTAGAIIYAKKRPDPVPGVFGFHEVFHLFILAGAGFFYWAVLAYLTA